MAIKCSGCGECWDEDVMVMLVWMKVQWSCRNDVDVVVLEVRCSYCCCGIVLVLVLWYWCCDDVVVLVWWYCVVGIVVLLWCGDTNGGTGLVLIL